MSASTFLGRTAGVGLLAGGALAAYAAWEARQYTLREVTVPLLPSGHEPLRVLHLSDIHMTPEQHAKQEWLASLADLEPDLVINTGDNLAHRDAVEHVVEPLADLLRLPGAYVLGSNDYFEPTMRNPLAYLGADLGLRHTTAPQLPWGELKRAFSDEGWLDLTNGFGELTVRGTRIAFVGVDDPHLSYDDLERVAGPADATADVRLAVVHAPYLRVLDAFARDGYDAIIAGHTHGGQVCLPTLDGRGRALTTNCDLEPARAKGLHRHPAASQPGDEGSSWLHVSAGLGTNPYVRFRVACRPEATLMTFVPEA
ncbi:metallophosphoesterase [Nocardioides jishulii]|uniref:Metallophosphoesterase n=1 Tax=Nocardioides jishulii TaxID=2575440 RepID=A0A4U2YTC5_9ACTN|nr:metallophosphoesterase [Nocardioides jishulii]QCX28839.1 metallophosphoesterase [Nocardioides jishulii]TKI64264.1 metallophosphoesterase [Nocardioides jishulii]